MADTNILDHLPGFFHTIQEDLQPEVRVIAEKVFEAYSHKELMQLSSLAETARALKASTLGRYSESRICEVLKMIVRGLSWLSDPDFRIEHGEGINDGETKYHQLYWRLCVFFHKKGIKTWEDMTTPNTPKKSPELDPRDFLQKMNSIVQEHGEMKVELQELQESLEEAAETNRTLERENKNLQEQNQRLEEQNEKLATAPPKEVLPPLSSLIEEFPLIKQLHQVR